MQVHEAQSTAAVITAGRFTLRGGPLAAAPDDSYIRVVVRRGGGPALAGVAPMRCERSVEIIPGKCRLFDEPGALDNVSALLARWFSEPLQKVATIAA